MQFGQSIFALFLRRLANRQDGQDLVEYALGVALIALAAFVGIKALAQEIVNEFTIIISTINSNIT